MAKSKPKTKIQPKTEGQRLLLLVEGTEIELAQKIACSNAMVGFWRRGARIPSDKQKHRLELLFGIPRRAWDLRPGEEPEPEPEPEPKPKPEPEPEPKPAKRKSKPSSRAIGKDTLTITKLQIDDLLVALDNEELTDGAESRLRDTLTRALALRTRLERDRELTEDKFVREHPEWLKIKTNILEALKPFPDAAKAVIQAIGGAND